MTQLASPNSDTSLLLYRFPGLNVEALRHVFKTSVFGEKNWDIFLDVQYFLTMIWNQQGWKNTITHWSSTFFINYGNLSCSNFPSLTLVICNPSNKYTLPSQGRGNRSIDEVQLLIAPSFPWRIHSFLLRRNPAFSNDTISCAYMIKLQFSLSSVFQPDQNLASNHKRSLNWLLSF